MKVFFILLLLSNIAFAAFQWLVPYEQLLKPAPAPAVAEQLRLLNEPDTGTAAAIREAKPVVETAMIAAAPLDGPLCYTLGPFKQQAVIQQAVSQFKQNGIELTTRSSVEKEYMGMMVYIDGHPDRQQAVATADALREKGIRDYIIVNEPERPHLLSLGVFGLKKNADRRQQRIAALGYDVKTEPRYRNRTIFWLDYSESENESLEALINDLKQELGISRISRQCA